MPPLGNLGRLIDALSPVERAACPFAIGIVSLVRTLSWKQVDAQRFTQIVCALLRDTDGGILSVGSELHQDGATFRAFCMDRLSKPERLIEGVQVVGRRIDPNELFST